MYMEYQAIAKNIKVSPRKVRLVADQIRELSISSALTTLMVSRKRGAVSLKKALESAMANAVNNNNAKKDDLKIKTISITEGIRYKRFHYAGRGRTRPYVKRTSHINVVLMDGVERTLPAIKLDAKPVVVEGKIEGVKNEKKAVSAKTVNKGGKK